jgi:hypothetical protein
MPEMTRRASLHSAPQAGFGRFRKNAPRKERNLVPPKTDCALKKSEKCGRRKTEQSHGRRSRSGDRIFHKRQRKFFRGADPLRDRMCHFLVV